MERLPGSPCCRAFPGELRPLIERATVRETLRIGDRVLRVGTLAGVPVVLGLLGIGLVNAEATTALVLDRFDVEGVIVSGVAGAPARIGDVTIPARWSAPDGTSYDVDPALLRLAERAAPHAELTRCAPVPPDPPGPEVCVAHEPRVLIGGTGTSDDPFGGRPLPCTPDGGDVFGCDVAAMALAAEPPAAVDMETAAAARAAQARGVPFIALRAVSDGEGIRSACRASRPSSSPGTDWRHITAPPRPTRSWRRSPAGGPDATLGRVPRIRTRAAYGSTGPRPPAKESARPRRCVPASIGRAGWQPTPAPIRRPSRMPGTAPPRWPAGDATRQRAGAPCARALEAALRARELGGAP